MKVTIVQADIQLEQAAANLAHYEELVKNIPADTQLIVLPEMFSTGFSMQTEANAEPMDGASLSWMQRVATQRKCAVLGGVMIRENGNFYNRCLFVFPDGSYRYYDKRHLFSYGRENDYYTAGNQRVVVEYLGWRFCLQVCYDLRFPVWSRNCNDYDVLVYVASWPDARQQVWSVLPVARALENQSYVLVANRVGKDSTGSYAGESRIIDAKGQVLASGELYKEQLITAELSLSELQRFREKFNVSADADSFTISV